MLVFIPYSLQHISSTLLFLIINKKRNGKLPMASIKNKDVVEVGDVSPVISRNINIYTIYSLEPVVIRYC